MIVSASRRTDLPAFYAEWFMSRVRAGFCEVPNPFRRGQVTRVSLNPAEVDAVVFWTRNPLPLLPHLKELDRLGLRYVFLVTILGYPPELDPGCLPPARAVQAFQRLSEHLGPDRVTWRYDPLILTPTTDADWHRRQFAELARKLQGHTRRCKLSLVDLYAKLGPRLRALQGTPHQFGPAPLDGVLLRDLAGLARQQGIEPESCAETEDLRPFGIPPGRCIDADLLNTLFGTRIPSRKDPGQRPSCGCAASRDIGMYDSCPAGCSYCYAVRDFAVARRHRQAHDPLAPRMLGPQEPEGALLGRPLNPPGETDAPYGARRP